MQRLVQLAVGSGVLAILLHTFAVMGIVSPMYVSAGSMAPHLLGSHWKLRCPDCGARYTVGADAAPQAGRTECPECSGLVLIGDVAPSRGDTLHVERTTVTFRPPSRWEPVVFRCPHDARRLCIKRVIGLPGETIYFEDGDLFVDGRLQRKSLSEQMSLRVLVHREREGARRWTAQNNQLSWIWQHRAWRSSTRARARAADDDWLVFTPRRGHPVTDGLPYNAGVARERNTTADLMLTFRLTATGRGRLWIDCGRVAAADQQGHLLVAVSPHQRTASISRSLDLTIPPGRDRQVDPRTNRSTLSVAVSLFDRRICVSLDGRQVVCRDLASPVQPSAAPFAFASAGLDLAIDEIRVWRDVFYVDPSGGAQDNRPWHRQWRLGDGEYFVAGDNPAVSDDSRNWRQGPGLHESLIVGRPLGCP